METGLANMGSRKMIGPPLMSEFFGSMLITIAYIFPIAMANPFDTRAFAYFTGWIFAASISGAHFNPATSIAVFMMEKKKSGQAVYLIFEVIIQFVGSFTGILICYLIMKPTFGIDQAPLFPSGPTNLERISPYYLKIMFIETIMTFIFTFAFLMTKYSPAFQPIEKIIKGISLFLILSFCYYCSIRTGACFNPALALTLTTYLVGLINGDSVVMAQPSSYYAKCIWIYFVFPIVGAALAVPFF